MEPLDSPDHIDRVNDLFSDALNLPSGERPAYVARHAGSDLRLRDSVVRMLSRFDSMGGFLNDPPLGALGGTPYEIRTGDVLMERFRIMGPLGRGGMGEVYRAEDFEMQDIVALKIIRAEWRGRDEVLARFRKEIRLTRRVAHPNVCPVYEPHTAVLPNGASIDFFTMKYLDGETLADRMAKGALPAPELLRLARGIAAGLDAAHAEGVSHRDLKPGNIILVQSRDRPEWPVITDFGLASLDASASEQTSLNQICGSPYYMAPEQFSNDALTPAVDIYALGLIIFEMATGKRPFPEESITALAVRRAVKDAPRLEEFAPHLPKPWGDALAQALSRKPAKRPHSAGELVRSLEKTPKWSSSLRIPALSRPSRRIAIGTGIFIATVSVFEGIRRYREWGVTLPDAPTLMLTNLTHSADARDGEIARTVDTLLETQLQQSAHLRLITRDRVEETVRRLKDAGRHDADLHVPRVAREVALRQGASFILFGNLGREGDEYTIRTRLELLADRPETEREHWTFERVFRDDDFSSVSPALSRMCFLLRKQMGESQRDWELHSSTPEQLTTTSWTALQKYVRANEEWREDRQPEAFDQLREALSIDPEFTAARSRLADLLMATGDRDGALDTYRVAVSSLQRKRLDDRESFRVRGIFELDTGQFDKAAATFREYRRVYPRDAIAYFQESGAVRRLGQREYSESLLRDAIRLDPGSYTYAFWLAIYELENGELKQAGKQCELAARLRSSYWTDQLRAALAFGNGSLSTVRTCIEHMRAWPESRSSGSQLSACFLAELGQWAAAEKEARDGLTALRAQGAPQPDVRDLRICLAEILLRQDDSAEAIHECESLIAEGVEAIAAMRISCLLARAGNVAAARKCAAKSSAWPVYQHWAMRLHGELELAEGRAKTALEWMQKAPASLVPNVWPEYLVRAAVAAGDKAVARTHINSLLLNPARFFFQANFVGPGFIRWAVEHASKDPGFTDYHTNLEWVRLNIIAAKT